MAQKWKDAKETIIKTLSDFKKGKLILGNHEVEKYNISGVNIENHISNVFYVNEKEESTKLVIFAPQQSIYGFNYVYDLTDKEKKNPKGLQISYPMTSKDTIKSPTEAEVNYTNILHEIWLWAISQISNFSPEAIKDLPEASQSAIELGQLKGKNNLDAWKSYVKYPFDYVNSSDEKKEGNKKTKDKNKPQRFYVKLITQKKKTGEMICITPIYDDKDQKLSAFNFIDKPCKIEPAYVFEGFYYGSHGSTSVGVSLRFKVLEANILPGGDNKPLEPTGRLLPSISIKSDEKGKGRVPDSSDPEIKTTDFSKQSVSLTTSKLKPNTENPLTIEKTKSLEKKSNGTTKSSKKEKDLITKKKKTNHEKIKTHGDGNKKVSREIEKNNSDDDIPEIDDIDIADGNE